jgi:hypothetical protein
MSKLVNTIIDKLQTSSFSNGEKGVKSNIILFSDVDVFPEPPYVVIKPEAGTLENTRQFRIIAHARKGEYDKLEKYILNELDALLLGEINDNEGGRYKLYNGGYTDVFPEDTDNTYFMEHIYYTPLAVRR